MEETARLESEIATVMMNFHQEANDMNYIKFYDLKPGDKVEVPKSNFNLVQHHTVVLGQDFQGQDLMAENVAGSYVRIITAADFFLANPRITRITPFVGSSLDRRVAIQRALEKVGSPYDLINFNCEHFANYVQSGKATSDQVSWGLLILGILAIALLAD